MSVHIVAKRCIAALLGAPDRVRLWGEIESLEAAIARREGPNVLETRAFLDHAKTYWKAWEIQQGWVALKAAKRALLADPQSRSELELVALVLVHEAEKISGWREKAIQALIATNTCTRQVDEQFAPRIIKAVELRDDFENTRYLKIAIRRRNLVSLSGGLWLAIAVVVLASLFGLAPRPFQDPRELIAVVVFGVLGAAISVSQSLLQGDLSAKLPDMQVASFFVWMRPGIGAAAAIVAVALAETGLLPAALTSIKSPSLTVILAVAAGYSERFIVGALNKASAGGSSG